MKGLPGYPALLCVIFSIAGCASTGVVKDASPISNGTRVSNDIALIETSSSLTNVENETHLLNDLIVTGLREKQIFTDVEGNQAVTGSSSGIKAKAELMEIKKVSHSHREWAGALAGRARIVLRVEVSDLSSGRRIQTFEAEGESSGGSNLAGTTEEAVQRAAEQVVAEIVMIIRQTGS